MKIRQATKADKPAILELFDEFSMFIKEKMGKGKELVTTAREYGGKMYDEVLSLEKYKIMVVEDNGRVIGLCCYFVFPVVKHGVYRAIVHDLFVTEKFRGQGVGRKLFQAVLDDCKKMGIEVVKLDSGLELTGAHKFYQQMGGKFTEKMFRFEL